MNYGVGTHAFWQSFKTFEEAVDHWIHSRCYGGIYKSKPDGWGGLNWIRLDA